MEKSIGYDKQMLVLTCPVCGAKSDEPLTAGCSQSNEGKWVKTAAYLDRLTFCDDDVSPKVGDVLDVNVKYPVCCKIGETFSATIGDDGDFITMQLLKIKKHEKYSAKVRVKILEMHDRWTYVEPVPKEKLLMLQSSHTYNYKAPEGDTLSDCCKTGNNTYNFSNSLGGGDVNFDDYIYTDKDGVDHLVQKSYSDFDLSVSYYGDKVLGMHKYSPYFKPPKTLSDGTTAPQVPHGYAETLSRTYGGERLVYFLREVTKGAKGGSSSILGFDSINHKFTNAFLFYVGRINIEGFLYVVRMMADDFIASAGQLEKTTVQSLYNDMASEIAQRSYKTVPVDKYLY